MKEAALLAHAAIHSHPRPLRRGDLFFALAVVAAPWACNGSGGAQDGGGAGQGGAGGGSGGVCGACGGSSGGGGGGGSGGAGGADGGMADLPADLPVDLPPSTPALKVVLTRAGTERSLVFGAAGSFLECGEITDWGRGVYGRPAATTYHPRIDIDLIRVTGPGIWDGFHPAGKPMDPTDWGFTLHENPTASSDEITTNWQASSKDCFLKLESLEPTLRGTFTCKGLVRGSCNWDTMMCTLEKPPGTTDATGFFQCPYVRK